MWTDDPVFLPKPRADTMSFIYIDAALLNASKTARRDQIFTKLCGDGYDVGAAMIAAREQVAWEFREWVSNEYREQCDVQKDYDDQRQGDWTR